ncbi:MAG TPA: HAMP domain-containing sensor histidine kinase [Longimicrobiales bacterium]|nr:HAMP domain-containing sensor histidine kinase [Longimicrobiales bacterium]
MTVRTRLFLTLGGIILLLVIPAVYGTLQLERLADLAAELEVGHADDIRSLGQVRASLVDITHLQRNYVATPDEVFRERMNQELALMRSHVGILATSMGPERLQPLREIITSMEAANRHLEDLVETGRTEAATAYLDDVRPLAEEGRMALNEVGEALDERGREAVAYAQEVSSSAARTTALAGVIALLLTLGLGLWTTDALSRPLRRLSDATGRVADGEFRTPEHLPYDRADEIGHLSRSFGSMTERLAELDRLKAEFVSLASHELKTPINVIAGYTELLDEGLYGDLENGQREVLQLVQEQTQALTRLVNQLLDLSRFEAGGLRVEPGPVDVKTLLAEVEQSFRALAAQKQIDFRVEADPSMPSRGVLDHDRIRHEVLGNLLSNAFKFTPTGGRIEVRGSGRHDGLGLRVTDTGVGIPEDQLDHIFEKYYQVGEEARAKGTGLGLAIAKQIVEAHGGSIKATSRVGEGTEFQITLPMDAGTADAVAVVGEAEQRQG